MFICKLHVEEECISWFCIDCPNLCMALTEREMFLQVLDELPFSSLSQSEITDLYSDKEDQLLSIKSSDGLYKYLCKLQKTEEYKQLDFDYFTEEHFNQKIYRMKSSVDMSVLHLNIRSLNANHRALCQYLQLLSLKFEVIVLSEIWSYNIQFYHNILPDYKFHYVLPNVTSVGGVGMYIKSKYSQTVVKDYAINSDDTSRTENLWIQIINGKTKYIIGCIYRHPSGSLTEFSNNLEETMCKVSKCTVYYSR